MKEEKAKKQKKPKEGRRLKTLTVTNSLMPFIMPQRCDALNYIADSIDIGNIEKYVARKRAEGYESFGIIHVILAAYVRTVAERPQINRFVRGQRIYARNGIQINMTIKKEMTAEAPDTIIQIDPSPYATAVDIYKEFDEKVRISKQAEDTSFDSLAKAVNSMPRFILRFFIRLLNFLDYYGLLPRALTDLSPFHGSLVITSMGSLGIPPIYHHIYNFGNVPLFIAFGQKRIENVLKADGTVVTRKMIDYKITTDERTCDGFTYALALKNLRFYLKNPEKLDVPPVKIEEDIR